MALFRLVDEGVPPRLKAAQETLSRAMPKTSFAPKPVAKPASAPFAAVALSAESSRGEPVTYQRKNSMEEAAHATDKLYEPYAVQTIAIEGAKPHPTALVQSASMASVAPPMPSYVPRLPRNLVTDGFLSDAQIETIIYAGEAHQSFLAGHYKADDSFDRLDRVAQEAEGAVQFRKGYFLGMARAAARVGRRPGFCSTTGCRAAAGLSGFRNPTNFSKMRNATGRRSDRRNSRSCR